MCLCGCSRCPFVAFVDSISTPDEAWLAWSIYGLRDAGTDPQFYFPVSINSGQFTDIRHFHGAARLLSVPVGLPNPWGLISHVSLLLLLIFFVDATITVLGDR